MMPFYRSAIAKASQISLPYLLALDEVRFSDTFLQPALRASFWNAGTTAAQSRQIRTKKGRRGDSRQIARRLETREKCVGDFVSRHTFLAVTRRDIARPVTNVLTVRPILRSQENRGMSVLVS